MTRGSYKHTAAHNQKIAKARMGEGNGMYKASNERSAIHIYMHHRMPKTKLCQSCNKTPPIDLANISQLYLRDAADWEWLCRKCHMTKDGRLEKFKMFPHGPKGKGIIVCDDCKQKKLHHAFNLCHPCYDRRRTIKRYGH